MKKLFKWLLLLTAALAVGITVLLYNPGLVKGPLERYLSDVAGYPISLEGQLEINTGRLTEITAVNIHISSPDWAIHPDLMSIGNLNLTLDTSSLFENIIVIDSLQVDDLQLNLETDANGMGNWVRATAPPPVDSGNIEVGHDRFVIFNNIQLNDAGVRFKNGEKGIEQVLQIASLEQHQQPDGMLLIGLDGAFNDRPVELTGSFGPYVNLLGGHDISYSANGHFGDLNITGSGLIDDLRKPRRPRFNLEIQGPNIDEITAMLGLDDLGSGGFLLQARGNEVNDFYEADINGDIGDVSLDVVMQVSDLSQLDELDLKLTANGPKLGSFMKTFGVEKWPDEPFRLKGEIDRVGGTLNISNLTLGIGSTTLTLDALLTDFPSLNASRIKLSISGDEIAHFRDLLGISGIAKGPFELNGRLDVSQEEIELVRVDVENSLGRATLSGTLGPAPDYIGTKLHLHMEGNNAHTIMSAFDIDALPEQPFRLDTQIETVENGMLIKRGVLVTIQDEQLELGGFLSFNSGSKGTDVEVRFKGQHLNRVLQRMVGDTQVPDQPYLLSGRVRVVEEGVQLENVKAELNDIKLTATGLLSLGDKFLGTGFDFQFNGDDLSALGSFAVIGDSLDIFVPGQTYQASGRFAIENTGWHLKDVKGRVGETELTVHGLVSNQPELAGSKVHFSIEGPELYGLLVDQGESILPPGTFKSSGQITLSNDTLSISDFKFETVKAHGKVDLDLVRPVSREFDASFNVDIWGEDIRYLLPRSDMFEPEMAAYKIKTVGQKQGDLILLQHFDADIGNLQVRLKGKLDEDPTDEAVDITFSAVSSDLSALGRLNGSRLPAIPLNVKADFNGNARQFVIHSFIGTLGESHIAGTLDVSLIGQKPDIKLAVQSDYIDVRPFIESTDSEEKAVATGEKRLIPAIPLPLEALAATDMTIRLNVAELRYPQDSIRNLGLEGDVRAGSLTVPYLSFDGPRGKLKFSLSIKPTDDNTAEISTNLNTEEFTLNISKQEEENLHQVPTLDINLQANGKGSNLQELAGSINGSLFLGSRGGSLEGVNLRLLDTFILDEIFNLIMPKTDVDDDLDLTCASAIMKITDGLVETDPAAAFTTGKITLIAKGTVDLKTEKMKINFNAIPNNALKISAGELFNPYILVGGTLGSPQVGLDPAKVLLYGGAAVGTAGISILAKGLIDRVGNTAPVCEEMLEKVQQKK